MNELMTEQTEDVPKASEDNASRDHAQSADAEGPGTSGEVYERLTNPARDAGKVYGGVFAIAQNGAKVLGEKVLDNTEKNSEAVFEAAKAVVRCKDMSEVAKVQSDFVQAQLALANRQVREFYELSAKISTETVEAAQAAACKAVSELKVAR